MVSDLDFSNSLINSRSGCFVPLTYICVCVVGLSLRSRTPFLPLERRLSLVAQLLYFDLARFLRSSSFHLVICVLFKASSLLFMFLQRFGCLSICHEVLLVFLLTVDHYKCIHVLPFSSRKSAEVRWGMDKSGMGYCRGTHIITKRKVVTKQ